MLRYSSVDWLLVIHAIADKTIDFPLDFCDNSSGTCDGSCSELAVTWESVQ